jgi:hypothetical protein
MFDRQFRVRQNIQNNLRADQIPAISAIWRIAIFSIFARNRFDVNDRHSPLVGLSRSLRLVARGKL